jgi:hypothetical protein
MWMLLFGLGLGLGHRQGDERLRQLLEIRGITPNSAHRNSPLWSTRSPLSLPVTHNYPPFA